MPGTSPTLRRLCWTPRFMLAQRIVSHSLALCHIFNGSNIDFGDVAIYLIYATVHVSKFQVIIASSSSFSIDPSQHAYLHVTGVATNCQKEQGSFELDVDRYISVLKPVQKVKPSAPTRSQICLAIKLESRSHTTNIMYQYSVF